MAPKMFQRRWRDRGGVEHAPSAAGVGEVAARRRIVSLVPSLTETLCAVGGRASLVGCTAFCTRPPGLLKDAAVVKVGGTKTIRREKILALDPDLVLLNLEENELADIEFLKAHVECYVNGVKTVDEGIHTLREVGALIGRLSQAGKLADQAGKLAAKVRAKAAARVRAAGAPLKVFYAIWRDPWMTVNRDTFIHDSIRACGGETVFAHLSSRYPVVSGEDILAAAPDVVWLPSEPFRFKEKHAREMRALLSAPAVAGTLQSRPVRVGLVDGDNVCWFGARQLEGLPYTFRTLWRGC